MSSLCQIKLELILCHPGKYIRFLHNKHEWKYYIIPWWLPMNTLSLLSILGLSWRNIRPIATRGLPSRIMLFWYLGSTWKTHCSKLTGMNKKGVMARVRILLNVKLQADSVIIMSIWMWDQERLGYCQSSRFEMINNVVPNLWSIDGPLCRDQVL